MFSRIDEVTGFDDEPIATCRLPVAGKMVPEMDNFPNSIEFYFLLSATASSSSFQCETVFRRMGLLPEPT